MTSSLVDDRVQSLLSRSKRKLQSVAQWASLRSRSRAMTKSNRFLLKRRSEILINFVSRRLESSLERLISTRLKRSLWKQINVIIAMNWIISIATARNSKNSESLKWTWKWYKRIEKKVIFVTDATKTKDLIISSFLMKNDLFDETFVLINCVLRNKIFTITMINIDVTEYAFVDVSVA
jgi:hypothetical protein